MQGRPVRTYNMTHIIEKVGRIPDDHLHCAQLAEITLQKALDDYLSSQV
jgi:hypothetical protein